MAKETFYMQKSTDGLWHGRCSNGLEVTVTQAQMDEYIETMTKAFEAHQEEDKELVLLWATDPEMWAGSPDLPDNPYNEWFWHDKKAYWIAEYERVGCINLSEQEKAAHSADEWKAMVENTIVVQKEQTSC